MFRGAYYILKKLLILDVLDHFAIKNIKSYFVAV